MWSPTDYFLSGDFCPLEDLAAGLNAARRQARAQSALLLAADRRAFLRTLTTVSPSTDPLAKRLARLLRETSMRDQHAGFHHLLAAQSGTAPAKARPRFPSSGAHVLERLGQVCRAHGDYALEKWLRPENGWAAVVPPSTTGPAPIAIAAFVVNPDPALVRLGDGFPQVELSAIRRLAVMVNATAQASLRRDTLIMNMVDELLDPAEFAAGRLEFESAVAALVRLASEVSQSDVGACYFVDRRHERLVRSGLYPNDDWPDPHGSLSAIDSSLLSRVLQSHRTLQSPPGAPDLAITDPTWPVGSPAGYVELATPIPGPLASPRAPAIGVLTVARQDLRDRAPSYGAYELALLRNVALRLALIHATMNNEAATEMFGHFAEARRVFLARDTEPAAKSNGRMDSGSNGVRAVYLPDDLRMSGPIITTALETLADVTGSNSVTFRAALPSDSTEAAHGVSLVRVWATPRDRLKDRGEVWPAEDHGIIWRVAVEGVPRYAPDVEQDADYHPLREPTRSQLCVPVIVEGRVIGVVNLESAAAYAYDTAVPLAQAFAQHAGLAVTDARLALSYGLLEFATEIVRHGHDIVEDCRNLRIATSSLDVETRAAISNFADVVERRARGVRELRPIADTALAATMPDIVEAAIERVQPAIDTYTIDSDVTWSTYAVQHSRVLERALGNVLFNVKRHASYSVSSSARIRVTQTRWGGRVEDLVIVRNSLEGPIDPHVAANLYRAPLQSGVTLTSSILHGPESSVADGAEVVPQFGAYLAGTLCRFVGGDIHACVENDDLRTVLQMPAPEK